MPEKDVTNITREDQGTQGPPAEKPVTAYELAQQLQKAVKDLTLMSPETRISIRVEIHCVNRKTALKLTSRFEPTTKPKAGFWESTLWLVSEPDPSVSLTAFIE